MSGWTLANTHPTHGRTFRRPLSASEHGFFWYGLLDGSTDILQHFALRLVHDTRDRHACLFSEENILRAWLSTKRRYPLVGATVQTAASLNLEGKDADRDKDDDAEFVPEWYFVVCEHDLAVLRPGDVVFGQVTDAKEAQQRASALLDGPRPLSPSCLVQLYVFHETADSDTASSARVNVLHMMTLIAHCVTDGMANRTLMRCFLDTLVRGGPDAEPAQLPLEERLAMVAPWVAREPKYLHTLSLARRRWRKAVGAVISQARGEKKQGGYTLPCRLTHSTSYTPSRSGFVNATLTQAQSTAVIAKCRQHNLTFGNTYYVLAQVAMTRVLYRRYLRGDISQEEWAYRKRQPYVCGGPLNLRPYLDKSWFQGGGGGEFMLSIGISSYRLPFMTLGRTDERQYHKERVWSDGAPPFLDLLTFDRFLHRAGLIKKQTTAIFSHPLFFEMLHAWSLRYMECARLSALQWMNRANKTGNQDGNVKDADEVLSAMDIHATRAHGGSSLGNVDLIFPLEYPIPPTHPLSPESSVPHPAKAGYVVPPVSSPPLTSQSETDSSTTPKITVTCASLSRLHTCPGELYLGAATSRGQLNMYVFYDANVFEDEVVREWLDEVRDAVLWYLGR